MSGQILGDRYEVEGQLGKKAGRWTLLARDLMTNKPVILKVLFIDENLASDDLKLFKREVDILRTIDHPATPQYLGYFEISLPRDGKALVLIQSYVSGKSLQDYMAEQRLLTEPEARQIAHDVLKILQYLHGRTPPIIHRDIKPSNILLSADVATLTSEVGLVDFGSVKSLAPSDGTTFSMVGTDGFIPPEQMGRRAVTSSDLYSLGVTLIAGMSGLEPDAMPKSGFRIKVHEAIAASPNFSAWLQKITEPELIKRYRQVEEALTGLPQ
ncbi:serine/threonine protein kinase [Vacuolonema iberomarrocanum]|uniref:serine/threonine protein kinase n=1 Tax=Vacuolonema iberomarrocanum TaxID=3454632 RepID=UPI0019E9405C|nr:serine/threonine protein kinase [filamentous cyanobacterium LEGE 07170]